MKNQVVCYCFGYTVEDIINDVRENGYLTIFEKIMNEKRQGKCDCARINPKGG